MNDLIKRDEAMKVAMWFGTSEQKYHHSFIKKRVMEIPSARPKGEWLIGKNENDGWCKCSVCGYVNATCEVYSICGVFNFCPNCGADMRERKDFQVIVNGNCTKCGKPLSGNRIFICEECEEQSKETDHE